MLPPVQQVLAGSTALVAIVGTRIYQQVVPADETRPYVVWRLVSGVPENNLSEAPDIDDQRVQVDFYSSSPTQARQMCQAGRDAIEAATHIVFGPWKDYEVDTKLHRWSFDCEWWNPR